MSVSFRDGGDQSSTTQSPSGAETQMRMSSSGWSDSSPVTTLRTVPSVLRDTQEKQMPMRQPYSGVRPAASACSSSGAPVFSVCLSDLAKSVLPSASSSGLRVDVLKYSTRSRGFSAYVSWISSISPAGPQAQVSTSAYDGR